MKILSIIAFCYLAVVASFESLLGYFQPESAETLIITTFDEDGKEYKVEDLSEENKILYNKVTLVNQQRLEVIGNANFEVEKLEILGKHYSNALKEAVEGEDTKVEVAK